MLSADEAYKLVCIVVPPKNPAGYAARKALVLTLGSDVFITRAGKPDGYGVPDDTGPVMSKNE